MNVHVLYDLAQQTQDFISFSWFPCVGALVCLLFAIIPWRRLQRSGSRKWALVYAWAMCVVTAWVVGGSFLSYYLDIQKYRKYRDWFHSVEYDTVEGRCVLSSSDSNPLGSDAPQVFRVDNKTFEYGLWSDLNHGITSEIIDPLQASGERIRVYYSEGLIFRIEQEKAAKKRGNQTRNKAARWVWVTLDLRVPLSGRGRGGFERWVKGSMSLKRNSLCHF